MEKLCLKIFFFLWPYGQPPPEPKSLEQEPSIWHQGVNQLGNLDFSYSSALQGGDVLHEGIAQEISLQ